MIFCYNNKLFPLALDVILTFPQYRSKFNSLLEVPRSYLFSMGAIKADKERIRMEPDRDGNYGPKGPRKRQENNKKELFKNSLKNRNSSWILEFLVFVRLFNWLSRSFTS